MTQGHFVVVEEIIARPLPWPRDAIAPAPYRAGWRSTCRCGWVTGIAESRDAVVAAGKEHKAAIASPGITTAVQSAGATSAGEPDGEPARGPVTCDCAHCRNGYSADWCERRRTVQPDTWGAAEPQATPAAPVCRYCGQPLEPHQAKFGEHGQCARMAAIAATAP